uniref:Uncharacterized protein n=1 Tax=Knipowitschia caucasica TaxID=637954 RepID=A0AAV2LB20_KNICA
MLGGEKVTECGGTLLREAPGGDDENEFECVRSRYGKSQGESLEGVSVGGQRLERRVEKGREGCEGAACPRRRVGREIGEEGALGGRMIEWGALFRM